MTLLDHFAGGGLRAEQNALGVYGHVFIPIGFFDLQGGLDPGDSGIVDQDVKPAKCSNGLGHDTIGICFPGDIHPDRDCLPAGRLNLLRYRFGRGEINVSHHYRRSFTPEAQCDSPAQYFGHCR